MSAIDDVARRLSNDGIRRIKLGVTDIDGILRGKYISLDKFFGSTSGLGFCDVIFGWDMADVLYDNCQYTGWHTGYPDAQASIDLSTLRTIPWEPGTALFLLDLFQKDGEPLVDLSETSIAFGSRSCSRSRLRCQIRGGIRILDVSRNPTDAS